MYTMFGLRAAFPQLTMTNPYGQFAAAAAPADQGSSHHNPSGYEPRGQQVADPADHVTIAAPQMADQGYEPPVQPGEDPNSAAPADVNSAAPADQGSPQAMSHPGQQVWTSRIPVPILPIPLAEAPLYRLEGFEPRFG